MDNGEEILREIKGMKASLFGDDGTGGIVRCLHDLTITVCGNPSISNDGGMAGDLIIAKEKVGLLKTKTEVTETSLKRAWWLISVIVAAIIGAAAWVIRAGLT